MSFAYYLKQQSVDSRKTLTLKPGQISLKKKMTVLSRYSDKRYIFGHSEDQNIFLIYIWSSSLVPGLQLLKPLEFPVTGAKKVSFVILIR